ncbi:hypothetical protein [Bradyrhizobium sp. USDA 4454]
MRKPDISIGPEDHTQPEVRRLIALSDAYLAALYPPDSNHLVDVAALAVHGTAFPVARRDGEALGSIAFRIIAPGHAEMRGPTRVELGSACSKRWRMRRAVGRSHASAWSPESGSRKRSHSIAPPATRNVRRSATTPPLRSACS